MAYSNTNRDKEQVNRGVKLKTTVFAVGLIIVTISSLTNIYTKWVTLKEARDKNNKIKNTLDKVVSENQQMKRQMDEASGSGIMSRKARAYFGLGTSDDYWLILPKDEGNLSIKEEGTVIENEPNILKWWDLFTK